jgi:hypothetical protein
MSAGALVKLNLPGTRIERIKGFTAMLGVPRRATKVAAY